MDFIPYMSRTTRICIGVGGVLSIVLGVRIFWHTVVSPYLPDPTSPGRAIAFPGLLVLFGLGLVILSVSGLPDRGNKPCSNQSKHPDQQK
jgi:hypothetical protein